MYVTQTSLKMSQVQHRQLDRHVRARREAASPSAKSIQEDEIPLAVMAGRMKKV